MRHDLNVIDPKGHATDLFTDWACEYLEDRASRLGGKRTDATENPFFLYLAYNAPHDPIQPPPEFLEQVRRRVPSINETRANLVALIEHMDSGIGKVLETLDRLNLADNTLVFFTSDNGGILGRGANNGQWRSEKQHMYEGGLRVPAVARWPKKISPNSQTDRISLTMDLFATIAEIAEVRPSNDIDGVSMLSTMLNPNPQHETALSSIREYYFVRREGGVAYGGKTIEALIRGDWKLVQDSPFQPMELYYLKNDPRESVNLIDQNRKVADELSSRMRWHIQRGGETPWQLPFHDHLRN